MDSCAKPGTINAHIVVDNRYLRPYDYYYGYYNYHYKEICATFDSCFSTPQHFFTHTTTKFCEYHKLLIVHICLQSDRIGLLIGNSMS